MPTEKSISVIITSYNYARYLPESLGAIVEQSFKPKEVLVVDDASTDNSVEIIEGFARRYPFVRLIRNASNKGVNRSLRIGLEQATGDYIFFTAVDDKILPGLFEKSMALLARYPQAGLCSSLTRFLSADGKDMGLYQTSIISEKECFVPPERYVATYREYDNWILTYSAIFARSAVLEDGGPLEELGPHSDAVMIRNIAMKHGSCFIPEALSMWRRVAGGYGHQFGQNFDRSMKQIDYTCAHTITPGDATGEEYIRLWKRRMILMVAHHIVEETPCRYENIAALRSHMPFLNGIDRLFFAGTKLYPLIGPWPIKLYLFYNQRFREKLRIIRLKLSLLMGRAAHG